MFNIRSAFHITYRFHVNSSYTFHIACLTYVPHSILPIDSTLTVPIYIPHHIPHRIPIYIPHRMFNINSIFYIPYSIYIQHCKYKFLKMLIKHAKRMCSTPFSARARNCGRRWRGGRLYIHRICMCGHVCVCVWLFACLCARVCVCVCVYTHMYICICTPIFRYIYIYIHTYMYMYM